MDDKLIPTGLLADKLIGLLKLIEGLPPVTGFGVEDWIEAVGINRGLPGGFGVNLFALADVFWTNLGIFRGRKVEIEPEIGETLLGLFRLIGDTLSSFLAERLSLVSSFLDKMPVDRLMLILVFLFSHSSR